MARRRVQTVLRLKREDRDRRIRRICSILIQSVVRSHLVRARYKRLFWWLAATEASQFCVARSLFRGHGILCMQSECSIFMSFFQVQRLVRGHLARVHVRRVRKRRLHEEACEYLQRLYRGWAGRKLGRAAFRASQQGRGALQMQVYLEQNFCVSGMFLM